MKYYNADNTEMIDLDAVVRWTYVSQENIDLRIIEIRGWREKDPSAFYQLPPSRPEIKLYFGGGEPIVFEGTTATEIYKKLTSQKELL